MRTTQGDFFDSLIGAVRDNPVAAALIGGGALWLLVGDEKLKNVARSATAAASPVAEMGTAKMRAMSGGLHDMVAPPTAPDMDHQGSLHFGEMLRDARKSASDALSGAGDQIRDRLDESVAYTRESFGKLSNPLPGQETLTKTQSLLVEVFERQPLVLGAIGLAIGAAVAGAFRTSDLENDWIGELSGRVKTDLNLRAQAVSESLGETADILKGDLQDAGAEAIDRVTQTSREAANAALQEMKRSYS